MRLCSACLTAAFLLLTACGDSGGPSSPRYTGAWSYSASAMTDPDYQGSCAFAPTLLNITQVADSIHGTNNATFLICTPTNGTPDTVATVPALLHVMGEVSGSAVSFDIDGPYWTHTGTRAGGTMSGTVTLDYTVGVTPLTLVGTWTSTRQ